MSRVRTNLPLKGTAIVLDPSFDALVLRGREVVGMAKLDRGESLAHGYR
jgi:hypothetical protein